MNLKISNKHPTETSNADIVRTIFILNIKGRFVGGTSKARVNGAMLLNKFFVT